MPSTVFTVMWIPNRSDLAGQVFRAADAISAGYVTYQQLRSQQRWRPVLRGIYADSSLPYDHRTKIKAATLLMPRTAAVTGRSAAHLLGACEASGSDPVDVLIPADQSFGPVRGLHIRKDSIPGQPVRGPFGFPTTPPAVTAWELAQAMPLLDAVPVIDALMHYGHLAPAQLEDLSTRRAGRRGAARADACFRMADPLAESPAESLVRVRLARAGLPPLVSQFTVRAQGRFVARVDLAWPQLRIAIEYDGAWHDSRGQFGKDRRRLNALVAAGWTVYHVTAADLADWDRIVRDLRHLICVRDHSSYSA